MPPSDYDTMNFNDKECMESARKYMPTIVDQWYKDYDKKWKIAERGEYGEKIPANIFEFIVKPNDRVIEGNLLIAFMNEKKNEPEVWECAQLEVEIW